MFGGISLLTYTGNLEKKEKVHRRKMEKSSGDGDPKLQISVPCGRTRPDNKKPQETRGAKLIGNKTCA